MGVRLWEGDGKAVQLAVECGAVECLRYMLEMGADARLVGGWRSGGSRSNSWYPVHHACFMDIRRVLEEYGLKAKPRVFPRPMLNLLAFDFDPEAVRGKRLEMLKLLLPYIAKEDLTKRSHAAFEEFKDFEHQSAVGVAFGTPLDLVLFSGHDHFSGMRSDNLASLHIRFAMATALLEAGALASDEHRGTSNDPADEKFCDKVGNRLFHPGYMNFVIQALDAPPGVRLQADDKLFSEEEVLPLLQLLYDAGADVNYQGPREVLRCQTALQIAIRADCYTVAKWLIDHGAHPHRYRDGCCENLTPLNDIVWIGARPTYCDISKAEEAARKQEEQIDAKLDLLRYIGKSGFDFKEIEVESLFPPSNDQYGGAKARDKLEPWYVRYKQRMVAVLLEFGAKPGGEWVEPPKYEHSKREFRREKRWESKLLENNLDDLAPKPGWEVMTDSSEDEDEDDDETDDDEEEDEDEGGDEDDDGDDDDENEDRAVDEEKEEEEWDSVDSDRGGDSEDDLHSYGYMEGWARPPKRQRNYTGNTGTAAAVDGGLPAIAANSVQVVVAEEDDEEEDEEENESEGEWDDSDRSWDSEDDPDAWGYMKPYVQPPRRSKRVYGGLPQSTTTNAPPTTANSLRHGQTDNAAQSTPRSAVVEIAAEVGDGDDHHDELEDEDEDEDEEGEWDDPHRDWDSEDDPDAWGYMKPYVQPPRRRKRVYKVSNGTTTTVSPPTIGKGSNTQSTASGRQTAVSASSSRAPATVQQPKATALAPERNDNGTYRSKASTSTASAVAATSGSAQSSGKAGSVRTSKAAPKSIPKAPPKSTSKATTKSMNPAPKKKGADDSKQTSISQFFQPTPTSQRGPSEIPSSTKLKGTSSAEKSLRKLSMSELEDVDMEEVSPFFQATTTLTSMALVKYAGPSYAQKIFSRSYGLDYDSSDDSHDDLVDSGARNGYDEPIPAPWDRPFPRPTRHDRQGLWQCSIDMKYGRAKPSNPRGLIPPPDGRDYYTPIPIELHHMIFNRLMDLYNSDVYYAGPDMEALLMTSSTMRHIYLPIICSSIATACANGLFNALNQSRDDAVGLRALMSMVIKTEGIGASGLREILRLLATNQELNKRLDSEPELSDGPKGLRSQPVAFAMYEAVECMAVDAFVTLLDYIGTEDEVWFGDGPEDFEEGSPVFEPGGNIIIEDKWELVKLMYEKKGLKLWEMRDVDDATGLVIAAEMGAIKTVRYMLQMGADTSATDVWGLQALHRACWPAGPGETFLTSLSYLSDGDFMAEGHFKKFGHRNLKVAKLLIRKSVDLNHRGTKVPDKYGRYELGSSSPLDLAMLTLYNPERIYVGEEEAKFRAEVVLRLLKAGAKLSLEGQKLGYMRVVSEWSLPEGRIIQLLEALLKAGADINASYGVSKKTALHVAGRYGHRAVYEWLASHGADSMAQDVQGAVPRLRTPIV
ncbi:hypothetical protein BJ508DRAFT_10494 [Ascobolus immersus RN42]|uniref:Ankyrin n=1 Tax=Ascobolus immersus RN42 TaxID=1160509 RepID=A0A3N4HRB9_ASCIM|nr:hypothetical protein BJ508DRAFT_10494 [Ascobolus immersus RN42]